VLKNKKLTLILLVVALIAISLIIIKLHGNTYKLKFELPAEDFSIDDYEIKLDVEDVVKILDIKKENSALLVKIEAVKEGKVLVLCNKKDDSISRFGRLIYVHGDGVITEGYFFGDCNGSIVIPISFIIFLTYVIYLFITKYKNAIKESIYQYKCITYLGFIVFLIATEIIQILSLFNYGGFINLVDRVISSGAMFSIMLLPIAFVVSILIVISNVVLVIKEGFNFRNLLGVLLGSFFCFVTISPDFLYTYLSNAQWVDINNLSEPVAYIYRFFEESIYVVIAYFECILLGTIILARKAAKHIPSFDKDYILILGCQIKKDGKLTNLLKSRVDRAIEFSKMQKEKNNKDIKFVTSGGKGSDEVISEADAMKNYLLEQGIKDDYILVENKSKNTNENIKFSNELIKAQKEDAKIAFSTTNYHVFRAGNIAYQMDVKMEGIGAKTKAYFWINAFIREYIATLVSEKKNHICIVAMILMVEAALITFTYFVNTI